MRSSTVFKIGLKVGLQSVVLMLSFAMSDGLASDYSDGFRAYLEGDYHAARKHWRLAAQKNDAKSMFNLGLLHEQNRLPDANYQQAESWFRLAADNGYVAADYHLAQRMLERGGSDDEAIELVKNAAKQGYAPAVRYLTGGAKPSVRVEPDSIASAGNESNYQSENWINRQRPSHWTIQLLAFKERSKVYDFIREHGLQNGAAYFAEHNDGQVLYKLVYGSYSTKDKASFARQNLSSDLREFGPWLRTISSVQAVTKR